MASQSQNDRRCESTARLSAGEFHPRRSVERAYGVDAWAVLAMITFALCCGCAIWVLLPHDMTLAIGGEDLLALSNDRDVRDIAEAYCTASGWLNPYLRANHSTVARLSSWLSAGCMLLAVEVALWIVSLAG